MPTMRKTSGVVASEAAREMAIDGRLGFLTRVAAGRENVGARPTGSVSSLILGTASFRAEGRD